MAEPGAPPPPAVLYLKGCGPEPARPGYGKDMDSSPTARAIAATAPDATAAHDAAAATTATRDAAAAHFAANTPDAATASETSLGCHRPDPEEEKNKLEWYSHHAKINTKGCPEVWVPVGTKVWKYSNELRTYVEEIAGQQAPTAS